MNEELKRREEQRLATLRSYQALDSPPEACFDRLTRAVASIFGTPLAFLTLIDEERAFLKSCFGADCTDVPRADTFCTHVVQSSGLLVVLDATQDERFRENRFVKGQPGIRFYAGAPLITPSKVCIGALSVVDLTPRHAPADRDLNLLQDLADEVIEQIEHRLAKRQLQQYAAALEVRERALLSSEESFRGLSLSCPAGIFKAELDGEVTYCNPTTAGIWCMREQDILGSGWLTRVHPEDRQMLQEGWIGANQRREYFEQEFRLLMPDGAVRWVHGRSAIICGENGDTIVGTVDDITARKDAARATEAARAEAEEANRSKDLFLANVSHELRTPLNGILGMGDLLLQSPLDAKARECAETIQGSGRILLNLVNDLLDTGKISAGTLTIEAAPFDLRGVISMAANYVRQEAEAKKLAFSIHFDETLPGRFVGDGSRIQQIAVNFLTNAVKFTDSGSVECRVLCNKPGAARRAVSIEVRDSGPGIPRELQAKLFKPFSQVDASSTRKRRGVGLGLSICRRLAELMGGSVGLTSETGKGSTFWLRLELPVAADPAMREERKNMPVENVIGTDARGRILVAEDNPINQRVVVRMLERLGWQVDVAADGVKALAMVQENRYALVLMDCLMPEADGYMATTQIREYERSNGLSRLPIVALTANALSGDRERCLSVGMDDYLSKPLQLHLLRQILERWDLRAAGLETPSARP